MKTRSKVICLFCAAVVTLSACQQNAFFLQNARTVTEQISPEQASVVSGGDSAKPRFSLNSLEEMEYQLELFSSRFFESMSLPHQPPLR